MRTAVINIKTTDYLKEEAQRIAESLGFSLSSIVNAYLNQFVYTRKIEFTAPIVERETEYLINLEKQFDEDFKNGKVMSNNFQNTEDAIKFLDNL